MVIGTSRATAWRSGSGAATVTAWPTRVMLFVRSSGNAYGTLQINRAAAEQAARNELQNRGVTLSPKWRVMAIPDDGSGGPHQFVYETAGDSRWRELLGVYLPKPRWRVRVATFEGDVADRAEEWRLMIGSSGDVRSVQHIIPEARAGASLDVERARSIALAAVKQRFTLDASQLRETAARPAKQKARTDWTFTFTDKTAPPLASGEPRIEVTIAGDEVASIGRYVHVPEEWERQQRAASTRNLIIQISTSIVFGGLLIGAAIAGMMAWSRGRYAPRLFLLAAAIALVIAAVSLANGWPTLIANLTTAAPLQLQLLGVIAIGAIGLTLLAAMIGLAVGALPARITDAGVIPDKDALLLGIAAGLFGAAAGAAAAAIRTPAWARFVPVDAAGTVVPFADAALDPLSTFMTTMAVLMTAVIAVDRVTHSWTRHRPLGIAMLAAIGFLAGGLPAGSHAGAWALAGLVLAAALVITVATLLRFDPTLVPIALGTMGAVRAIAYAVQRPIPGATIGGLIGAVFIAALAWCWFRLFRRVI